MMFSWFSWLCLMFFFFFFPGSLFYNCLVHCPPFGEFAASPHAHLLDVLGDGQKQLPAPFNAKWCGASSAHTMLLCLCFRTWNYWSFLILLTVTSFAWWSCWKNAKLLYDLKRPCLCHISDVLLLGFAWSLPKHSRCGPKSLNSAPFCKAQAPILHMVWLVKRFVAKLVPLRPTLISWEALVFFRERLLNHKLIRFSSSSPAVIQALTARAWPWTTSSSFWAWCRTTRA